MSLTTVGKNGRVYPRKFDHEEARARYAAGESSAALAREYGVTTTAVWTVVAEKGAKWRDSTRFKGAGRCERCGAPTNALSRYTSGSLLCKSCAYDDAATSVRPGELRCIICREWKPDEDFPHRHVDLRRRGRHEACRRCNTVLRREHRRRNRAAVNAYDRAYRARRRAEQAAEPGEGAK